MASATETASNAQNPANVPAQGQPSSSTTRPNARGDQGVFRGYQQNGFRGARGNGRSRGTQARGRSNHRNRQVSTVEDRPASSIPPPPGLGAQGTITFGRAQAQTTAGEESTEEQEEDVEAEVCFICASTVVHNCVAPCNHRTCHICALRLRALYKTRACAHCRVSALHNFEPGN